MELAKLPLLSPNELNEALAKCIDKNIDVASNEISALLAKELPTIKEKDLEARSWLSWCSSQKKRVKVVDYDIPCPVLPPGVKGCLYDIKVDGGKRQPDDKLYNGNPDLREKVARGNTILYLNDQHNGVTHDAVVFALKKFTGGMGDEDENQPETNHVWKDYFLKPFSFVSRVVCTTKANGEAAHLSARFLPGHGFVLIAGSKNVHMLVRQEKDINQYTGPRFDFAVAVSQAVFRMLNAMTPEKALILLSLLHHSRFTTVFEILQPTNQHVVDLSYLDQSELRFLSFSAPYGDQSQDSYCAVSPETSFAIAAALGIPAVTFTVIDPAEVENRMNLVRQGHGYEGEVFYFVDSHNDVIGLLKKKTCWYVLSRAIREKAAAAENVRRRGGSFPSSKVEHRLQSIQTWLGFSDACLEQWMVLGRGFLDWTDRHGGNVRKNFPIMWKQFLESIDGNDNISM